MTIKREKVMIEEFIDNDERVLIYLMNGIKLHGRIVYNEDDVIFIRENSHPTMMIYKHAIATIVKN